MPTYASIFRALAVTLLLISASASSLLAQSLIDSLEQVAKNAKPGWDQIDMAVGLARLYIGGPGDRVNGEKQIAIIYKNAEEQDIPEARAYALIMENLVGNNIDNDFRKSIAACEEAMKIARQYKCNDALVFAGYQLAERYRSNMGQYQKSKETLEELFPYMDETVDIKHIANAKRNYGFILTRLGEAELGFKYMEEGINLLRKMKTDPYIDPRIGRVSAQYADINNLIQYALTAMSESKLRLGAPDEARIYMEEALQLAIASKRQRIISWQYERFGMHYAQRGYYAKAVDMFQQSRILLEGSESQLYVNRSNILLADVMMRMEDYEQSQAYLSEALQYYRHTNDTFNIVPQLLLDGRIELKKGNLAKAEMILKDVKLMMPALGATETSGTYHQALGELSLSSNDPQEAINHFLSALEIYKDADLKTGIIESEAGLANAYLRKKNFDLARQSAEDGLKHAYAQSNIAYINDLYAILSKVYEANNQYEKALANYKLFFAFHDSVFNADAQVMLKEEEVRRNVVGIQSEKAVAEANVQLLEKSNRIYLIVGTILFSILMLSGYLYLKLRKAKDKIEEKNREREILLKEIHHRVKNNLQIISSILSMQSRKLMDSSAKSAVDEGRSRIKSMSLIHEKLYRTNQLSSINMQEYIEELSDFLFKTYKPTCNIKQDISTDASTLDIDMAIPVGLILNELISNALKYAYDGQTEGHLNISFTKEKDAYVLNVADSGKGLPADFGSIQSMGMRLVNALTEQLDGMIDVKSEEGANFTIRFKSQLAA